ncbi:Ribose transport system permease protein RbsC [Symbiodinium microadriaticum]|uniref:Ribose transport system permease protein RbsC n=2 Tax=cellular organisms TaxID=131567 RepID=A0A1Q9C214_SYMMI|nr:Ribose transport system permease protein RbsC [Symbiodinium microadriaticum]
MSVDQSSEFNPLKLDFCKNLFIAAGLCRIAGTNPGEFGLGHGEENTLKFDRNAVLSLNQEQMVMAISAVLFVLFSIFLDGFFRISNLLSLLQSVSILGILAIGMAVVVIGRGIDLTMVAVMVFSTGWSFTLFSGGMQVETALLLGLLLAVAFGAVNGFLIAYVEIPAIFATLAMATVISGLGRFALVSSENIFISGDVGWFASLGTGALAAVPMPVLLFLIISCLAFVALRLTRYGAFVYAIGDNPLASRNSGMSIRPMTVLMYSFASLVAFCAGLIMAMTVSSVNTKLASSTMIYDIILVVVIGGIGLAGGKGSIRNVISGTVLIGLLLNGLTIMNVDYSAQNIIKSLILLLAIIVDSLLNPRDEQTSQQGDI